MSRFPSLCFLLILSSATAVWDGSKILEGAETVFDIYDFGKTVTELYREFRMAYDNAAVEDKMTFGTLLDGVRELSLIDFAKLMASDPSIATKVMKLVASANPALKIIEFSKELYNYFAGNIDDSAFERQVEANIEILMERTQQIGLRVKDLGDRIVTELFTLKSILINYENTPENRLKFAKLIGEFDYNVHMIWVDIEQCNAQLSSIKTKIDKKLNLRLVYVIGGSVASGFAGVGTIGSAVAAAFMTNPITFIAGAVGLAGISIAAGVKAGAENTICIKLERIKTILGSYQLDLERHVEGLRAAGIPVANIKFKDR